MAAGRRDLADNVLGSEVDTGGLSSRQMRRLGQAQLDKSLARLFTHEAWSKGLGVHDPNTALAARHVLSDDQMDAAQCAEEAEKIFQYDSQILQNPGSYPSMHHTCHESYGGLCASKRGCAEAVLGKGFRVQSALGLRFPEIRNTCFQGLQFAG